jgi:hypothetical protein
MEGEGKCVLPELQCSMDEGEEGRE